MIELTDAQADRLCEAMAGAVTPLRAVLVNKDAVGPFQSLLDRSYAITGLMVEVFTLGATSAAVFRNERAQTLLNVIFIPGAWRGAEKALVVRHECDHAQRWVAYGLNGKADDKVFEPFPVFYLNKYGEAWIEFQAIGAATELAICALGATVEEVRSYVDGICNQLPTYGLSDTQIAEIKRGLDAIATGAFAGAEPSRITRAAMDAMRAMGLPLPVLPAR